MTNRDRKQLEQLGGQVKPGHIEVKLDFIPVSERLPDTLRNVYVRVEYDDDSFAGYYNPDKKKWSVRDIFGELCSSGITHWAEIQYLP